MAFSFKYTRYSAIAQIVLGALSIVFGIADRATMWRRSAFHSESVVPIWMGVWFVITGVIGCYATIRSNASNGRASRPLIGTYLGFSIVSVVFAAVIIIIYSIGVVVTITGGSPCRYRTYGYYQNDHGLGGYNYKYQRKSVEQECNTSTALGSLIIIFAIIEFGVGIWASICCCSNGCCDCCNATVQQPQMGQVVYVQTQHGPTAYVMTQGTSGVPVAVPAVVPGQVQMNPVPVPQVIYPAPAYTPGASGGGATGVAPHDAQAPPLETKSIPPSYQASV